MSSSQHILRSHGWAGVVVTAATLAFCGCGGGSSGSSMVTTADTSLSINFVSTPGVVAEKIGDGAWSAATVQGNTLTLSLPPGVTSYGIAFVCSEGSGGATFTSESIIEATIADDMTSVPGCRKGVPTTASLSGIVDASAISGVGQIVVDAPGGNLLVAGNGGAFTVAAQTGTDDIVFLAEDLSGNVLGVKIVRSQTVPGVLNNGNAVSFSASDATTFEPLTATNIPSGFNIELPGIANYLTANGAFFTLNNVAGTQYAVVPASEAQATDNYRFQVAYGGPQHSLVLSELTTASASAVVLALPAPLPVSAPTPAALPTFSFNYTDSGVARYNVSLFWITSLSSNIIETNATAAYQSGATSLSIPDLSTIQGFPGSASSGGTVNWTADVMGGTSGQSTGNISSWFAEDIGSYTEP